jgi:hypothetical protein
MPTNEIEKAIEFNRGLLLGRKQGLCIALDICADGGGFAIIGYRVNREIDLVDDEMKLTNPEALK